MKRRGKNDNRETFLRISLSNSLYTFSFDLTSPLFGSLSHSPWLFLPLSDSKKRPIYPSLLLVSKTRTNNPSFFSIVSEERERERVYESDVFSCKQHRLGKEEELFVGKNFSMSDVEEERKENYFGKKSGVHFGDGRKERNLVSFPRLLPSSRLIISWLDHVFLLPTSYIFVSLVNVLQ